MKYAVMTEFFGKQVRFNSIEADSAEGAIEIARLKAQESLKVVSVEQQWKVDQQKYDAARMSNASEVDFLKSFFGL